MIWEEWSGKLRLYRTLLLIFLTLNVFCLITAVILSVFFWTPAFKSSGGMQSYVEQLQDLTGLMTVIQEFESSAQAEFDRGVLTTHLSTFAQKIDVNGLPAALSEIRKAKKPQVDLQALKKSILDRQAFLYQEMQTIPNAHQQQRLFLLGICTLSFLIGIVLPLVLLNRLRNSWRRWQNSLDAMVTAWISRWGHALESWQNQGARGQFLIWLETGLLTLEIFGAKSKNWAWRAAAEIARHLQQRLRELMNATTGGSSGNRRPDSPSNSSEVKETA